MNSSQTNSEIHQQFNLPTPVPQTTQGDFELKQANILKTAKDLSIKDFFTVTNSETSLLRGQRFNRTAINTLVTGAVYSLATTDYLVGITSLSYAPNVGLPLPSLARAGKTFIVKDEVGGAATTTITVSSAGEKTIDGSSTSTITTNYGSKQFYSDGSQWFTI